MTAIAIIPARGGSRRIPKKNIRPFFGKPIIAYSIEAAQQSGLFDRVVVSTDSFEIGEVAEQYGAVSLSRSEGMGRDEVGTQEVMRDALQGLNGNWEFACCIYPCAPMMTPLDLHRARNMMSCFDADYCYPAPILSSVDPGMFYFGRTGAFLEGVPLDGLRTMRLALQPERCIDINTEDDWLRAERMYAELHKGTGNE